MIVGVYKSLSNLFFKTNLRGFGTEVSLRSIASVTGSDIEVGFCWFCVSCLRLLFGENKSCFEPFWLVGCVDGVTF